VMSSASSAVTNTSVYTDSEPDRVFWGADEEISDGGPKDPQTLPVPQDEDGCEPMFVQSLGYVTESNPEEDPEEYEDDETEDGPVDYHMDGEMMEMMMTAIHLGMTPMMRMRMRMRRTRRRRR
ncbi:hypothetical protein Tco_0075972, partial [Tanacetum coccineum]